MMNPLENVRCASTDHALVSGPRGRDETGFRLRPLNRSDQAFHASLYQSASVMAHIAETLNQTASAALFATALERASQGTDHPIWVAETRAQAESVALVGFNRVDGDARVFEMGIMLAEARQGQGVSRAIMMLAIEQLYDTVGRVPIRCRFALSNQRAERLIRSTGLNFRFEDHLHRDGRIHAVLDSWEVDPARPEIDQQ